MTDRSRVLLCLISVVAAGALVACGGSGSVTGPGTAVPAASATIAGTVVATAVGTSTPSGLSASSRSGGIRVSVVGTSLEATTDDDGRFTLGGVAAGETVELRFEGPGVDARLEIGGLVAGQTLAITVSLSGSTASMLTPDDETELRGAVEARDSVSLTVAGVRVLVDGSTLLLGRQNQPIELPDIPVGAFVEVEGWRQGDGSVLAKKVKLEDDDQETGAQEVEFVGTIQGLSPLNVGGTEVSTNDSTVVLDDDNNPIGLSDLAVGMKVEVEGWTQPDGSVLAKKIKIED